MYQAALAGLRVLDLAGPIGAYAGRLLAGLGADVVLVEPPSGNALRHRPPFLRDEPGIEHSLHHQHFHTGKRSLVLDLSAASDKDCFRALVDEADMLIETHPPGYLASLDFDYPALSKGNPGLVMVSITPFGQTGPRAGWRGTDLTGMASSGVMAVSGFAEKVPHQPGGEHAYHQAGLAGAVGGLVALWERAASGLGQHVDVSMQEALALAAEGGIGYADVERRLRPRLGLGSTGGQSTMFRCLDGWVAGILGNRWSERVDWLEEAGLLNREQADFWRDPTNRAQQGTAELDRLTVELFSRLPKEQIYHRAQVARMAIAPVRTIREVLNDRQLRARGFWVEIEQETRGTLTPTLAHERESGAKWSASTDDPAAAAGSRSGDRSYPGPGDASRTVGASDRVPQSRSSELKEWEQDNPLNPLPKSADASWPRRATTRDENRVARPESGIFSEDSSAGPPPWVRSSGAPFKMSATPWRLGRPAPTLGEHQDEGWRPTGDDPETGHPDQTVNIQPSAFNLQHQFSLQPSAFRLPLAGIRVLDFTVQGAGPIATRLLGALGADVIKVESSARPDGARLLPHPRPDDQPGPNHNAIFNNFNVDKRVAAISLEQPTGRALIGDLLKTVDIVADNFGRDPFPRWQLDADRLLTDRPDLIIARSSVAGRTGPDREYVGFGFGIAAGAGLNLLTGFPGDPPVGAGPLPDFTCNPYHLAAGILAALMYRRRTGLGQIIDLSQLESTVSFLGPAPVDAQVNDRDGRQPANRSVEMAPHGVYPCRGGEWCAIAVEDDATWQRMASLAGRGWGHDSRFGTYTGRKQNEDALDSLLSAWTLTFEAEELATRLQEAGVAASTVETNLQLLYRDEHLAARGYYRRIEHFAAGHRAADGIPFRLSGSPAGPFRPAPLLGEHTEAILGDLLGLAESDIAALYVDGAID